MTTPNNKLRNAIERLRQLSNKWIDSDNAEKRERATLEYSVCNAAEAAEARVKELELRVIGLERLDEMAAERIAALEADKRKAMSEEEKKVILLAPCTASFLEQLCNESNKPPCFQVTVTGEAIQRITFQFREAVAMMQAAAVEAGEVQVK